MSDQSSGIQPEDNPVEGLKATMKLSRDMGMSQRRKRARQDARAPTPPAAAAGPMSAIATESSVSCPNCDLEYEITPEVYGVVAECENCNCEFQIKAPRKVAAAPAVAPVQPAAAAQPTAVQPQPVAKQESSKLTTSDILYIGGVVAVVLVVIVVLIVVIVR